MSKSSRSPEILAWISLVVNLIFFVLILLVGRWCGYFAVSAVSWLVLSSLLVWAVLALHFRQRSLAEREKLDMTQMAQNEQAATIFQSGDERANLLAVAQRRLEVFEKWFLPVFSLLIGAYQLTLGILLATQINMDGDTEGRKTLIAAVVTTGVAFVSFLMSRYATGMSSQESWRPLRAGGSSFLALALLCFLLAIGLGGAFLHYPWVMGIANLAVPCILILLGIETLANIILDIYRPRIKGQYNRAAFDSRILGVINEPGGVFHSVAAAIDYQFGFQVSQTWFYKLLEKAILPLVLFGLFTLYILSCIVVISPGEEAIVEHFGNPLKGTDTVRHWEPGLHLKWPWPIDKVYRYPTQRIDELAIGYKPKESESDQWELPEPLLWGKGHYEEEYSVLVASEFSGVQQDNQTPPVGLLKANVPVHFRVKNLYDFLYNHAEPKKLLEAICYGELARLSASSLVEVRTSTQDRQSLLGSGRVQAESLLRERIQKAADTKGLGVEIVFLGVQGIHPPADADVAAKYQEVVGAGQDKQTSILQARAEYNGVLSLLAGSVDTAESLYQLSRDYQELSSEAQSGTAPDLARKLDAALVQAKGAIFAILRNAQAYAFEKPTLQQAASIRFSGQLEAYRASPKVYTHDLRLQAMAEAMAGLRKFVFLIDDQDREILNINLEEKLDPTLYDIGVLEETENP